MNRKILYLILALSIIWIIGGCAHTTEVGKVDADSIIGVWADKDQKYIYAFLENSKFKFWVFRDRPEKTQGVWIMEECYQGAIIMRKEQMGNLHIYTDKVNCCMLTRFSGNKLMLKKIYAGADWGDALDVCSDKVLMKIKEMPQE